MANIRRYSSDDLQYFLVTPHGFEGVRLPVIELKTEEATEFWWPVRAICEDALHVVSARQVEKLRSHSETAGLLRDDIRIKTKQGMRRPLLLKFEGLAVWFEMFKPEKLPQGHPLREALPRFQAAALRAVNDILWGKIPALAPEQAGPPDQRLTLVGEHAYIEHVEGRVADVERFLGDVTFTRVIDEDGAGVVSIPFVVERPGRYVIRLRQQPWSAPEVIEIVPEDDQEDDGEDGG